MKPQPTFRPGDQVIDRDGRRGTVLAKHEYARRVWYDVKLAYSGATAGGTFRRPDELRIDPTSLAPAWPKPSDE